MLLRFLSPAMLTIRVEVSLNIDCSFCMDIHLYGNHFHNVYPRGKYVLIPILFFESPRRLWTNCMQYIIQTMKIGIFYERYYLFM
jgi:hypothetical protein